MTTQAYGYGSVYQRSEDGMWIAAVCVPTERGEKNRRLTFSSKDRVTVEAKLHAYRADHPATEHNGRAENLRRARLLGTHTAREWWQLVRSCERRCFYCGRTVSVLDMTQDHIVPLCRGGSDAIDNLALTCSACNIEKGTMTGDEYRAWKAAS